MTRHLPAATLQRASRRTFVALGMALALAAGFGAWVGLPRPAAALLEEDRARSFIEGLAADAVEALTTGQATHAEKMQRFRSLLSDNFAVTDIGEWVLGRYWALATPEERAEYLELFEEMIVATYVRRFERYAGETLTVGRAFTSSGGGDILVDSQIVHPDGLEPVNVGWRVRAYDDGPKIVDVIVEGVSMGQTQRSEFGSVIRRNNGEISGLLSEMRRVVEDGR
jgi:phospholipid transport system substrate-binding protein